MMTTVQLLRKQVSDAITNLRLHNHGIDLDDKTLSMLTELSTHLFELTMKESMISDLAVKELIPNECPHDEPLHDHHDGCPSCDGAIKDTMDPLIKDNTTDEEQELLLLMWGAVAKRDRLKSELDQTNNGSRLWSECYKRWADAKEELKKQRKITLGKLYYSNNKVWKYLSSPLKHEHRAALRGESERPLGYCECPNCGRHDGECNC